MSRRWAIFIVTSLLFVLSQFYRASIAVITPNLMADLSLNTKGLSLMSAAFFYAFALTQIPLGIYLDRVGPRITMTCLSLIAVLGGLVFAWADSQTVLIIGRILLGVGMACNLMGTFKLLTLWFGPLKFATLTTFVISFGTAGNMVATTPLVLLVQGIGWRMTFTVFAIINLVLVIVFFLVVRDRNRDLPPHLQISEPPLGFRETLTDIYNLLHKRDYWIISWGTFCRYGVFAAVQTLWAGPYLLNVMALSQVATGNVIFSLNLGVILGGPVYGMLSDKIFKTRKWILVTGFLCLALTMAILAFLSSQTSFFMLAVIFFCLGVFNSTGTIMYSHIKERMPIEKAGTAMTGINFFTMVGAAIFLQGLGTLMQHLYPGAALGPEAFTAAFLLCAVCLFLVSFLYMFTTDTHG